MIFSPNFITCSSHENFRYGDQMMRLFHQHNFAFSRTRHWTSMLTQLNPHDESSAEITQMVINNQYNPLILNKRHTLREGLDTTSVLFFCLFAHTSLDLMLTQLNPHDESSAEITRMVFITIGLH